MRAENSAQEVERANLERGKRRLRAGAVVAWGSCGVVVAAALVIRFGHVMHPGWWWVGIAFVAVMVTGADGMVMLVRTARMRSWGAGIWWALLLMLPPMLCVAPLVYGFLSMSAMRRPANERRVPLGRGWEQISGAMGASLLDAAARVAYPRRTSGKHVTMLYKASGDPDADVAAMDAHVARMSELLGQKCTAKVHWVRGRLCGVGGMYFQGMSFGSDSRTGDGAPTELDRHEVAHFVIEHLAGPHSQPPSLLQEGWAQTQSGLEPGVLAGRALKGWAEEPRLGPAALVGRDYYDSREAIVYTQGGAFADFLLRRYGGPRFFELYRSCREASFAQDCERVLGDSLVELERLYGEDLEREVLRTPDREGLAKAPLRLLTASGRPGAMFLWVDRRAMEKMEPVADGAAREGFFAEYPAALTRLRQAYNPVTIAATTRYRRSRDGQKIKEGEVSEEFAQDGANWRTRTAGELPERIFLSTSQESVVFTATGKDGPYVASKRHPDGLLLDAEYDWHARLLPHRLGHRDVSELLSDPSFIVRDIASVEIDGEHAVELRYERLNGRERGYIRFSPQRSWAVVEFQKTEAFPNSRERSETFRYTYAEPRGDSPVIAGLHLARTSEQNSGSYVEDTVVTRVSFEQPDASVFRRPQRGR
jgi:hypothetical protein